MARLLWNNVPSKIVQTYNPDRISRRASAGYWNRGLGLAASNLLPLVEWSNLHFGSKSFPQVDPLQISYLQLKAPLLWGFFYGHFTQDKRQMNGMFRLHSKGHA